MLIRMPLLKRDLIDVVVLIHDEASHAIACRMNLGVMGRIPWSWATGRNRTSDNLNARWFVCPVTKGKFYTFTKLQSCWCTWGCSNHINGMANESIMHVNKGFI